MKILHLADTDDFLYHFMRYKLLGLRQAGYEVHVAAPAGKYFAALTELGLSVHPLPALRNARAYHACTRLLRRERFALVHTHGAKAGFIGRAAARRFKIPAIVHTVHSPMSHGGPFLWHALCRILERIANRWTHLLLAQSLEDAEALRMRFATPCLYEGSGLHFPSLCDALRSSSAADVRAKLRLSDDDIAVAVVAHIGPGQGHLPFIEAFTQAYAQDNRLVCFFAGASPSQGSDYAARVAQALYESPASSRMHMLGFREDVPALLRGMDMLVLPSQKEGIPRAVMEAMALGLCVAATNVSGTRELVVHGKTGLLVPCGDTGALCSAMLTLAADPALRLRMGAAGYLRIQTQFDEKLVIERLTRAYASLRVKPR